MNAAVARVLLVEDDPAIARTVAFALEREGFAVLHVLLLREALAHLRHRRQRPGAVRTAGPRSNKACVR